MVGRDEATHWCNNTKRVAAKSDLRLQAMSDFLLGCVESMSGELGLQDRRSIPGIEVAQLVVDISYTDTRKCEENGPMQTLKAEQSDGS